MKSLLSKDVLLLAILAIIIFVLNLGGYPLFDVDEPRYAETAREMLTHPGDWITPHFNWVTRFDKPVLFYWLIAGSYQLFGISEFSARLISALAATGTLLALYFFIQHLFNRKAALMTATLFATMLLTFVMARWSITDMTLSFFMAGTWLSLFLVLARSPRWYLGAGFFSGLGLLTKGPVAIALPGLTFLLAIAWIFRSKWKLLLSPWMVAGVFLSLAIALPWYIAVAQANPEEFVGSFVFLHNIQRFTSTVSDHSGPWYYYVPVVLAGAFPWILFAPGLVIQWFRQQGQLPDFLRYANLWFWVVFLFFSISGTKLLTYVLPAFPALAILLGWYLYIQATAFRNGSDSGQQNGCSPSWFTWGLWFSASLVAIALLISLAQPFRFIPERIQSLYNPLYTQIQLLFVLLAILASAILSSKPERRMLGFQVLSIGMAIAFCFANLFTLPMVARIFQADIVAFAQRAVQDNMPLATYKMKKPSLVFYTKRKVFYMADIAEKTLKKPTLIKELHSSEQALYLIAKNRDLHALRQAYAAKDVMPGHVYSLIQIHNPNVSEHINQ